MMKRYFLYALMSFLLFSLVNVICYLLSKQCGNIGYDSQSSFGELFVSPFCFSLLFFVCLRFIRWVRNKCVLIFPICILSLKILLILLLGYNMYVADFLLSGAVFFSNLFDIVFFQLQNNKLSSELIEIVVLTIGMFIYQVAILYIAKMAIDRWVGGNVSD